MQHEYGNHGTQQYTNPAFSGAHADDLSEGSEVRVPKVSASADVHDFSAEFPDHVLCLIWVSTERQPIYCRNTRLRLPDSELWNIWGDCSIALRDRGWLGGRSRIGMVAGKARQPAPPIRLLP